MAKRKPKEAPPPAIKRAERDGGRPSVSNVIRDLLERHRAEITKEANG
jgi:predicted CopG family antitoxin